MAIPDKDAFFQHSEAGEGEPLGRATKAWTQRLIVDGVEVDPETKQPIENLEE